MQIFVVGNINAGKSVVVDKLSKIFPYYSLLSIDHYRQRYGDGTHEKEIEVRNRFACDILESHDAIIEFSGGSSIASLFIDQLIPNRFLVIEVQADAEICLERIAVKDFSQTPYPTYTETIEATILRLDSEFRQGSIQTNFRNKYLIKYNLRSDCNLYEYPWLQYHYALKLVKLLEENGKVIISYGSMGAGRMNVHSDVDLFLLTVESVDNVVSRVHKLWAEAEIVIQKNQIAIFYCDQLLEVKVIQSIEEAKEYYQTAEIIDPEKTVLFDKNGVISILKKWLQEKGDNEFKNTLDRYRYFIRTLPRLINKQDSYKYYFHCNIILHEYMKLTYQLLGNKEYLYLPKNAKQYLSLEEWERLPYSIGENLQEHYSCIKGMLYQMEKKAMQHYSTLINLIEK